ncbi:MAG: hypothetical protein JKY80_06440 [Mariprofundaceae bacterium]|nr:hypothetical protein [Mariprofundaceae bacterium]
MNVQLVGPVPTPAGKAVHLEKSKAGFVVRGALFQDVVEPSPVGGLDLQGVAQ